MPDFTQTFLVTALPDSIDGSKLRLAVLVSPRLTAAASGTETTPPTSAPLSSWPDAQNWPSIAPVWEVTIEQGTTKAVLQNAAEIGAGGYDVQTWNAIFPGSMPTTPYQPPVHPGGAEDPSYLPPVATFPVSALQDAVKKLHVALLTDHRTAFPPADDLQRLTEFVPIKDALSPQLLTEVLDTQFAGKQVGDTVKEIFAQLDLFHGTRPGSALPPPTVTGISPQVGSPAGGTTVTITGDRFIDGASVVAFGAKVLTQATVVNPQTIRCTSPAGVFNTAVDVVVRTPGGISQPTAASKFTYLLPPTVSKVDKNRGPAGGGATVTITGTSFVPGNDPQTGKPKTTVMFGTAAATDVSVGSGDGTTLLCKTPAAAGQSEVDVIVTTLGGSSTPSAASKYTFVPVPTVTAVRPDSGPVAGGEQVTITGTGLTGATTVHFGTATAAIAAGGTDTSLTVTTPVGTAGPVHVTVTTDGGTSAESDADQYTYLAKPTVTALSPKTGPAAGGTTVTVTGTNLASATSVTFGGTAVTPTSVTGTSLKAVSPAGTAGDVHVVVHTTLAGDSTESDADLFTYTG